jgi:glyoxylase-like metal-dependent hydrolase (beta-lactamase superfamily II)
MYGLTLTHTNPDPATHGAYIKAELKVSCNFQLVEEDFELLPGINVITLPDHTPGVLGLVLKLKKSGTFIFPADAIYTSGNYGPPW